MRRGIYNILNEMNIDNGDVPHDLSYLNNNNNIRLTPDDETGFQDMYNAIGENIIDENMFIEEGNGIDHYMDDLNHIPPVLQSQYIARLCNIDHYSEIIVEVDSCGNMGQICNICNAKYFMDEANSKGKYTGCCGVDGNNSGMQWNPSYDS